MNSETVKRVNVSITHARHDIFVVNKRYVEEETGQDEKRCIQVLDFGVVYNWPNNQVNRYDQNNNRNHNWNLSTDIFFITNWLLTVGFDCGIVPCRA